MNKQKLTSCLWFDQEAKEAGDLYYCLFQNSQTGNTSFYGKEGHETHCFRTHSPPYY